MNNNIENKINLGGSLERGISGNYELKITEIFKEAWNHTMKNLLSFSPSIVIFTVIHIGVFYIALKLQLLNFSIIIDILKNPNNIFDSNLIDSLFLSSFITTIISAPIYAGISLMAMSHVAGLSTKKLHIIKGLQFTIPVILATFLSLLIQNIAEIIFPFLSLYFSVAFSNSILLICEKGVLPIQSLLFSFRAINKKLFVIIFIYLLLFLIFLLSILFYGIGLIFTIPFFFHVKGIIYRNMFGIELKIISTKKIHKKNFNA
ncbi:hypothetical protein CF66_2405 [Candidatus Photodesmus katoptron]|uniref:Proline and glycine rich transmembrane protein gene in bax n=1 Tax=Candidatus Photodesmus katoptron Akat1 TaxID=1236703 RepID=S3DGK4_9GAMM|nr:hypothetical protein [Candidatus Photodesmus katoptron]EPE37587.1 hypothetical protein O1U_0041 [Candidatus Photodesmus katoptron Akat1]KEY90696.1 hypothetical protein CF66_2405 [Candidatus Photodesmus katoptron]